MEQKLDNTGEESRGQYETAILLVSSIIATIHSNNSFDKSGGYLELQIRRVFQKDFLPYYAWPFIPDPTSHPSLKPLFASSDLKRDLQVFLAATLTSEEKPQLYTLFMRNFTEIERARKLHNEQLKKLQLQLTANEQRFAQFEKRYLKIQGDYHKLIGVAAELVDSLEDAVRGKIVTPEYLQDICMRLFSPSVRESLDVSKPGTASSMPRASVINDELPRLFARVDVSYKQSLDYKKIKMNLLSLPERAKAFLLQALRWNLTQAPTREQRDSIVNAYIIHDLLSCSLDSHLRSGILDLVNSPNEIVRQFPHWYQAGIKQISDLFDSCEGHFLPFNSFCNKFNVKCNFLQYYSILSSIPQNWKKVLQEGSRDPVTPPTSICSLSCKTIYSMLLNLEDLPPPTSEKKLLASGVEKSDLTKIYLLSLKATREIKLTMFQYKIIHRILPTNSLLRKMKKVASPSCPFCPSECQTLWHLFINCMHASSFWNRFQEWYSISSNTKLLLSELEVMFGIIRCHTLFSPQNSHYFG